MDGPSGQNADCSFRYGKTSLNNLTPMWNLKQSKTETKTRTVWPGVGGGRKGETLVDECKLPAVR